MSEIVGDRQPAVATVDGNYLKGKSSLRDGAEN